MNAIAVDELRPLLCENWCRSVDLDQDGDAVRLSLPFIEPDGDATTVWLRPTLGGWRVSDGGTTLMRLSYEHDVETLLQGGRGKAVERILAEQGVSLHEGELFAEYVEKDLSEGLLAFGQAMSRVGDVGLWTRSRVASTFYDDLKERLDLVAGPDHVKRDFILPGVPDADAYPIDFAIEGKDEPLYVFGVPTKDKARLATIVLQWLQQHAVKFNSLVVFQDMTQIALQDVRRLMNAANDMVDSIDARDALDRKLRHRLAHA